MSTLDSKHVWDVIIIGNGSAAAGAVLRLKAGAAEAGRRPFTALVLEARTKEELAARIPEYNARVTFPEDLPGGLDLGPLTLSRYERVAYYTHGAPVRKNLPAGRVVLVDVDGLVRLAEEHLPPCIQLRYHRQVYDVDYVQHAGEELLLLVVQYPFGEEKVFEDTGRLLARSVIDCSGTGSVVLDKLQGYRHDSEVVCGVLAFKVIGAKVDPHEVSLGLDDSISHGAGSWAYPNAGLTPQMRAHLDRWFSRTTNPRIQQLLRGKTVGDFAGTLVDVGISSIAPYANAQHYQSNLERQAEELFARLAGYREMFHGAAVVPGSVFYKPSPVLQPVQKMAGRRYLLAGDAAGHATPYIGEGVRPGMEMGYVAAGLLLQAFEDQDFSEERLLGQYEREWWDRYGHYDLWSDAFRHLSSKSFSDPDWAGFLKRLDGLSDAEFYRVLRSEYDVGIVRKMVPYEQLPKYLLLRPASQALDFVTRRLTPRQIASWLT